MSTGSELLAPQRFFKAPKVSSSWTVVQSELYQEVASVIYQEDAAELYRVITLNYIKILLLLLRYRKSNTAELYQAMSLNYVKKLVRRYRKEILLNYIKWCRWIVSGRNCYQMLLRPILPSSIKGDTAKILSRQNYIHCNIAKNLAIIASTQIVSICLWRHLYDQHVIWY